jgi:hypothetical protein
MSNDILQLQQPINEGGISSVNFFNGRLLTGKDLSREQAARREADRRYGLAHGEGIAFGLDVERDTTRSKEGGPVLRIASGLAVNRRGQALRLTVDASVALTRRFGAAATTCTFAECKPIAGGAYVAGAGVYVLTIAPAESAEGRAPTNGLDPSNVRCNTDATVEGLQFRLHSVPQEEYRALGTDQPWFRNVLAYRCFGQQVNASRFDDLLDAAPRQANLLETLQATTLTDHDVPLALLYITGGSTIAFIDTWSVRRSLSRASADAWTSLVDDRRLAVGQAMLLQFQRQMLDTASPAGELGSMTARSHFRYLPPAGVIAVPREVDATDTAATRFFAGMTYRGPAFINAARVEDLIRESLGYPPIDTQGPELVWLYRVRENSTRVDLRIAPPGPRSYVVFASGHLPYRADAQFDLAYWNYANFALDR